MKHGPDIASLAALIGDPARANMLTALMAGKALAAGELAIEAGVTPQTASSHLAKLVEARLLFVEVQGRHRYFRIAGPDIAEMLEALIGIAARTGHLRTRPGPREAALRFARTCYDHLAGAQGVVLYDRLVSQGYLVLGEDGIAASVAGRARLVAEGIDITELESRKRPLCRACLDWSERRPHLAGSLGAALLLAILARGWAKRDKNGRAILFSPNGQAAFAAFMTAPAALRTG